MRIETVQKVRVTHFGKAIGMSANDGHVAGLGIRIVEWNVLLHGESRLVSVAICSCCNIFAGMCAIDGVLDHAEELRHFEVDQAWLTGSSDRVGRETE